MIHGLFPMRLARPVRLSTMQERIDSALFGWPVPERKLRAGQLVSVVDVLNADAVLCQSPLGLVRLHPDALKEAKRVPRS